MTGKPVRCGVCGKAMESKSARTRHLDQVHRIAVDEPAAGPNPEER
jgi:hypothetical protein